MEVDTTPEPEETTHTVQARLVSETGEETGPAIDLPVSVTVQQLGLICNALLQNSVRILFFLFK